jgi:hypothetical protein
VAGATHRALLPLSPGLPLSTADAISLEGAATLMPTATTFYLVVSVGNVTLSGGWGPYAAAPSAALGRAVSVLAGAPPAGASADNLRARFGLAGGAWRLGDAAETAANAAGGDSAAAVAAATRWAPLTVAGGGPG